MKILGIGVDIIQNSRIKKAIKNKNIKEITLPFNDKDWHILHSLQHELSKGRYSVNSRLKAIIKDNQIIEVKLIIE